MGKTGSFDWRAHGSPGTRAIRRFCEFAFRTLKSKRVDLGVPMSTGNELAVVTRPAEIVSEFDRIEHVVRLINAVGKRLNFILTLNVGKLVIEHFFGGDFEVWRKRGHKDISLRKLSNHPDLVLKAPELYRAVAMYELCHRLSITPRGRLSTTHLRYCLPLPPPEQERLLRGAEADRWSVERLREEIARSGPKRVAARGGRKPGSPLRKALRNLRRSLAQLTEYFANGRRWREESSFESALEIAMLLQQTRRDCSTLLTEHLMGPRRPTVGDNGSRETAAVPEGAEMQAPSAKGNEVEITASAEPAPNILIVEDDELVSRALCKVVSSHGSAIVARTVADACALLADTTVSFDAAIFDLQLVDGSGLDVLVRFRVRFSDVAATVLTGCPDSHARNVAHNLRVDFLEKPINTEVIRRFLGLAGLPARVAKSRPVPAANESVA